MVDPAVRDRVEDRVARLAIAPFAPPDQQRPPRVRVDSSRLHEKRVRILAEPVTREHERDVSPDAWSSARLSRASAGDPTQITR